MPRPPPSLSSSRSVRPAGARRGQGGQALVESALTLPLVVFLVLGTLQLFLMLQARILAQVAVFRAVRAGSLNHGDCAPMLHSALVTVLPALTRTDTPQAVASAFALRKQNTHSGLGGFHAQVVELVRVSPASVAGDEDLGFDLPTRTPQTHEVRMLFWYYMKVPFANWVMGRMFLAHLGLRDYDAANPLMPVERHAGWMRGTASLRDEPWPGGDPADNMRRWAGQGHYLFPIRVEAAMRMMTPAKARFFEGASCPLTPPSPSL